ncbi:MAG: tRNA ((46)-N7)-methyltransferase TrmB [Caulobacter sp.]|nr:tRNA ((46)-N7)-methyltransferase TrmB [Caulobacter sp.]
MAEPQKPPAQVKGGPLRSYGRVQSRTVKPRQAALMQTLAPTIAVPDGPVDPAALMPQASETWLEIGFGGGEHMAQQADLNRQALIIGAEPFVNGFASALRHVDERGLTNVRLLHGDARELLERLPDNALTRVFILFPDPWPKARHNKRRIIQPELLADIHRVLQPGGRLRFATDVAGYADWTLERVLASGLYDWPARNADDWRVPPEDHITTRYETKKLGDCAPVFFDFASA